MQKPNNFDNVSAGGDFEKLEIGGHHLMIKKVEETRSKTGKDMIVVYFDTALGDKQPTYFTKQFVADIRPDKKWPRAGRQYILVLDNNGNTSRNFKSFINCVEKSNNGFMTKWGDMFGEQFRGKRIGGVFGLVESEYNGKVTARPELRWFCDDDKADVARVPDRKNLPNSNKTVSAPPTTAEIDGFLSIPSGVDEEIPF